MSDFSVPARSSDIENFDKTTYNNLLKISRLLKQEVRRCNLIDQHLKSIKQESSSMQTY